MTDNNTSDVPSGYFTQESAFRETLTTKSSVHRENDALISGLISVAEFQAN